VRRRAAESTTWRAPIALALASLVGLLSALFADGVGDVVSWVALAAPVAAVAWCMARSA
jgi:hypothetical protein